MYIINNRPLAADTLTGKPTYNHTLSPDECLSEPFTILQLNMKTVTVSQLEVTILLPSLCSMPTCTFQIVTILLSVSNLKHIIILSS